MVAVMISLVWAKLVGYLYAVYVEVKGFLRTLGRVSSFCVVAVGLIDVAA